MSGHDAPTEQEAARCALWTLDNASFYTQEATDLELAVSGSVSHPPYSPDQVPFNLVIFSTIMSRLKGRKVHSLQELRAERITQQYKHE